jgi:ribosomal protein L11 methyltransferase
MTNEKQWIEVAIPSDLEMAEMLVDILQTYGHQGVLIERDGFELTDRWEYDVPPATRFSVKAYFPLDEKALDRQNHIREAVRSLGEAIAEPEFRPLDEKDWASAWKAYYQPLRLGEHLYICPEWIDPSSRNDVQPDDILIRLDPGMAFGTGTHASTQLCLVACEALLKDLPAAQVLDLGCGSGILSVAAAKLGASYVLGLDIDEVAITATIENARLNQVATIVHAQTGSLESLLHAARRFDVALVNILAHVIIRMCDNGLGSVIRPGGVGIFSGLILEQADAVEAALRRTGLDPYARRTSEEWVVIEARRPH